MNIMDNSIAIKPQIHFLNFVIALLNCIMSHFNYNKKLYKIDRKVKISMAKKNFEFLKCMTIGDIISAKISRKYISIKDNANKNTCEELKDIPVLNKILSENYLVFFKKFYYNSDTSINLKDYGLDKDIIFTKNVKNFKQFLKDNKNRGDQYIKAIKRHILKRYFPDSFIC